MKIFKWYLINDLDKYLEENYLVKNLKRRLKIAEEQNYKYYKEIQHLKEENLFLKNHQKIEIVNLEKVNSENEWRYKGNIRKH